MKQIYTDVKQYLHTGHVIANHILVSFHVAFISSLLNIPADLHGPAVLRFVFVSHETFISALFWLISFHTGIAIHEMGHYLKAVRVNALKQSLLPGAKKNSSKSFFGRVAWYANMFIQIPYGAFKGIKKEGLTYYPEAPFNLSVAAAGPRSSRCLAYVMLPVAVILLVIGLIGHYDIVIYIGRLCLAIGAVGLLDFLLADPGKLREFTEREKTATQQAKMIKVNKESWIARVKGVKDMMRQTRIQEIVLADGEKICAPWQFRNCGMGGRHTEKEYPESNISMQEMMFLPLCARDYEEAQMITITLQNRLKEIIENEEGSRVMGIGLEGGLAPYVSKATEDVIPEQRLWRMAVQAIKDTGYSPGSDIAIAFDPALSELSNAYRKEFKQVDCVGMYYFWRGEEKVVMSREQLLDLYKKTVEEIPIISLEDALAEDDYEGWRRLMEELGDKVFIIGDDLVTTKDSSIEECADKKMINTVLIKANQIGTLSETMIAILVGLGKGLDVVVSHRSKSPNDDMEAQIALATNALGLKTGGGANTERLIKYGTVTKVMKDIQKVNKANSRNKELTRIRETLHDFVITDIIAYEEPTNAGIPTVGVELYIGPNDSKEYRRLFKFTGATPLGTSAGMGEAIHLVDSIIEKSPVVEKHHDMFSEQSDKTYRFKKDITEQDIRNKNDKELSSLWHKVKRYNGKGCQNAVNNVTSIIAKEFVGKELSKLQSIVQVDRILLTLERDVAINRGKLSKNAGTQELVDTVQSKANIGMNAILSVSLALGRMIAHIQGKDLWQLLRTEMEETMAKIILAHGGEELMSDKVSKESKKKTESHTAGSWQHLAESLSFEDLVKGLQVISKELQRENMALYDVLRKQMPVYELP